MVNAIAAEKSNGITNKDLIQKNKTYRVGPAAPGSGPAYFRICAEISSAGCAILCLGLKTPETAHRLAFAPPALQGANDFYSIFHQIIMIEEPLAAHFRLVNKGTSLNFCYWDTPRNPYHNHVCPTC